MSEKNKPSTRVVNIVVPVTAGQDMSDDQLRAYVAQLIHPGEQAAIGQGAREYWEEDPDHSAEDWRYAVANGDTRRGYWEWVAAAKAEAAQEAELPEPKGPVAIGEAAVAVPPRAIVDVDTDSYSSSWGLYTDAPVALDFFDYQEFRANLEDAGPDQTEGVSTELRDLALKHGVPFGTASEYISEMMELLKEQEMPCRHFGYWDLADENGWTLAHQAAKYGHLPVSDFHEWNLTDKNGVSVRDVAKEVISKPKMGM